MALGSPTYIFSPYLGITNVSTWGDINEIGTGISTLCRGFGELDKANLTNIGVECGLLMLSSQVT